MAEMVWLVPKVCDAGHPSPLNLFTYHRSKNPQREEPLGPTTAPADADFAVGPKINLWNPKLY